MRPGVRGSFGTGGFGDAPLAMPFQRLSSLEVQSPKRRADIARRPGACPLRDNRVYRALPLTVIKLALATGENHGLYRLRSKNFSLTGRQLMAISWHAKQEEQGDVNPFFGPRNSGSHLTRRWREMDSNHRSPVKDQLVETVLFDFPAEARKRTIGGRRSQPRDLGGNLRRDHNLRDDSNCLGWGRRQAQNCGSPDRGPMGSNPAPSSRQSVSRADSPP